jgi:hypothetical protein
MRSICLAYEQPPHPDAVCHFASEEQVFLVSDWLTADEPQRRALSQQLRRYLALQSHMSPLDRPAIPCRHRAGLYVLIPWRLALWLAAVLPAAEDVLRETAQRLNDWLAQPATIHGG